MFVFGIGDGGLILIFVIVEGGVFMVVYIVFIRWGVYDVFVWVVVFLIVMCVEWLGLL